MSFGVLYSWFVLGFAALHPRLSPVVAPRLACELLGGFLLGFRCAAPKAIACRRSATCLRVRLPFHSAAEIEFDF
jgi:hypothetical protein